MLTYITTYYNEKEHLGHLKEMMERCTDPRLKMIIVDDYSDESIEEEIRGWNDNRVTLFRVTEDKGFNSHGARNLAMMQSTTEWNLLVDIDYRVVGIECILDQIAHEELEPNTPHFFQVIHTYDGETVPSRASINDFLVTKSLYWKAKGYDSEFIGFHYGDRTFIDRMLALGPRRTEVFMSVLFDCYMEALRSPFVNTYHDPRITKLTDERYSTDRQRLYVHPDAAFELRTKEIEVKEKHLKGEFLDPTPFSWEQLI